MRFGTLIAALLPALALCRIVSDDDDDHHHRPSRSVSSTQELGKDEDFVIDYRQEDATLSFKLPSERNWDEAGRRVPSVEDETFVLHAVPHIDTTSPESGLTLNGSMLVPDLRRDFLPRAHGTQAIDILYSEDSPLNRIYASSEWASSCLHYVKVLDDCAEENRTKTMVLDMHNGQNRLLAGLTVTYMLGDHPRIIRFTAFSDLAAFYDQENSRHWKSPLLTAIAPGLGMAAADVVFSDTMSSMRTTYMDTTPTKILSSIPLATTTATSSTISSTTSAPATRSTSRTAPSVQEVLPTPSGSSPQTKFAFQHPLGRTFQKVLAYAKSLSPCKDVLDPIPHRLSDLRLPKHVQISLAASRPTPLDGPPNPPSPPTPPPNALPTTTSNAKTILDKAHHYRALKWTAIIFILVCIGCLIFGELIGDPRRRVDRAASREERRNRWLYHKAARKERWRRFWAGVGQNVSGRLDGRFGQSVWTERWRRRSSNAVEAGLYRGLGLRGGDGPLGRPSFDEKGFRIDERPPSPLTSIAPNQPGPSDLAHEIYSLRYTHAVVDRMVRAEEGHAGAGGPTTSDDAPFRTTKAAWNRVPRVVHHARRWSSASNKTASDVTGPPPYGEGEDPSLVDVDLRSEGTGKSVNTDDTPDSSVVGTSPRASLFARERDRDSSGCGSDVE